MGLSARECGASSTSLTHKESGAGAKAPDSSHEFVVNRSESFHFGEKLFFFHNTVKNRLEVLARCLDTL